MGVTAVLLLLALVPQDRGLAEVQEALLLQPGNAALLRRASSLAQREGLLDQAVWYAWQAAGAADDGAEEDLRRARQLDPVWSGHPEEVARLESLPVRLLEVARGAVHQGYSRTAADLLLRCRGTAAAAPARAEWEALWERDPAGGLRHEPRRSWDWQDAVLPLGAKPETSPWARAWERRTDHYRVRTNLDYPTLLRVCDALEQMHHRYRETLGVRGRSDRVTVRIYATRAEFEEHEGERARGVRGFYDKGQQVVAACDPRAEGGDRAGLWSTLFHEAAHPFLEEAAGPALPPWASEGLATCFEGVQVSAGGGVRFDGVPEGRLRWLVRLLDLGQPDPAAVLAQGATGGYTADCYPVGWGLAYFLLNYEDQACERVYRPHLLAYLRAHRRPVRGSAQERFVEYFVRRPDQDEVQDLDQFLQRWQAWIRRLHEDRYGPPEVAERWRERARRQLECGHGQDALDSLRHADERRPGHRGTLWELAELEQQQGDTDAALLTLQRLWETLQGRDPEQELPDAEGTVADLQRRVQERIQAALPALAAFLQAAADEHAPAYQELATRYYEAGLPRCALCLLDEARRVLGAHASLDDLRRLVAAASGEDAGQWRRWLPDSTRRWDGWLLGDGALQRAAEPLRALVLCERMPERYRITLQLAGDSSLVGGLVLGSAGSTQRRFGLQGGSVYWWIVHREETVGVRHLGDLEPGSGPWQLEAAVDETGARLFLEGRLLGRVDLSGECRRGGAGVYAAPGAVLRDLRVRD